LTGFLLSSLFISLGGFLTSLAQERWELARAVMDFALGDVSGTGPRQIALAFPLVGSGCVAAWAWGRPLDLMLTGEEEARSLGGDVDAVRRWCVVWIAILTAAAVAIGGNVGFVGLIVPHVLRGVVGPDHRVLLPACIFGGAGFVVACDTLARVALPSGEFPVGVVTALLGGPFFLSMILRSKTRAQLWGG
jgi:iron complex transport system permease protein